MCTLFFHRACTNVELEYYRKLLEEKTKWKCNSCETLQQGDSNVNKQTSPIKMSPDNSPKVTDDTISHSELTVPKIHYLEKENEFLTIENSLLKKLVQEMQEKNNLLQEKFDNLRKSTDNALESLPVLEKQPEILKRKLGYNEVARSSGKKNNDCQKFDAQEKIAPVANVSTKKVTMKNNADAPIKNQETAATMSLLSHKEIIDVSHDDDEGEFTKVTYRRQKKIVRGTGTTNNKLNCIESKIWIFLGRCARSSSVEDVLMHLDEKFPKQVFEVTDLESKGSFKSFRIGAAEELKEQIYEATVWPKGAIVTRYLFRKSSNRSGANFEGSGLRTRT